MQTASHIQYDNLTGSLSLVDTDNTPVKSSEPFATCDYLQMFHQQLRNNQSWSISIFPWLPVSHSYFVYTVLLLVLHLLYQNPDVHHYSFDNERISLLSVLLNHLFVSCSRALLHNLLSP